MLNWIIGGVVVVAAIVVYGLWKKHKAVTVKSVVQGVKTDVTKVVDTVKTDVTKAVDKSTPGTTSKP